MRISGLLVGVVLVTCAAGYVMSASSKRPASAEAKTAYAKMNAASKALTASAQRIASGSVSTKDMPQVMLSMCKQRCEMSYFQCTMHQMDPGIPDFSGRPPKDFPIEIPDCEGPDCESAKGKKKPGPNCTNARNTCNKACDCQFVR